MSFYTRLVATLFMQNRSAFFDILLHFDRRHPPERSPCELKSTVAAILRYDGYREFFHRCSIGFADHSCYPQILRLIVLCAPLPGLLVYDEVDSGTMWCGEQRVGTCRHLQPGKFYRS